MCCSEAWLCVTVSAIAKPLNNTATGNSNTTYTVKNSYNLLHYIKHLNIIRIQTPLRKTSCQQFLINFIISTTTNISTTTIGATVGYIPYSL